VRYNSIEPIIEQTNAKRQVIILIVPCGKYGWSPTLTILLMLEKIITGIL